MKLCFFTDNYYPETNAAANRCHERAKNLVEMGHEVTVVTSCPNFPEGKPLNGYKNRWYQEERISGVRVIRLKTYIAHNKGTFRRSLDFASYLPLAIIQGLKLPAFDCYVASSPHLLVPITGILVSGLKRRPLLVEIADIWPGSIVDQGVFRSGGIANKLLFALEGWIYRHADGCIGLSKSICKHIKSRVPEKEIRLVYNGYDDSRSRAFQPKGVQVVSKSEAEVLIGYMGNLGPSQSVQDFIKAFSKTGGDHLKLIIAGRGSESSGVIALLEKLKDPRIFYLGALSRAGAIEALRACDLAAIPLACMGYLNTVMPSKLFEAMGEGVPLLYYGPSGECAEFIKQHDLGIVVESVSTCELTDAVSELTCESIAQRFPKSRILTTAQNYTRRKQAASLAQFAEVLVRRVGDDG